MVPLSTNVKEASCTSIPRLDASYQLHHNLHLLMWAANTMDHSILHEDQELGWTKNE
jgi:hypothetical protein